MLPLDHRVLNKQDIRRLGVFERKILGARSGPTKVNDTWRIKYTNELYELYSDPFIQSHSYIRRGNRRLSLAALPGLPAASRGIRLPLLANTRSVF